MRVFPFVTISFCAIGLGGVSGFRKPTTTTTTTTTTILSSPTLMKLRGGAGPLDGTNVAKYGTAIIGLQGLLNILCPEAMSKAYGLTTVKDENLIQSQSIGYPQVAATTCAALILFQGVDVNTAMAYSFVVHMIGTSTSLINGSVKKMGANNNGPIFWLIMHSAVVYGLFNNTDWAINLVKALCGVAAIPSVMIALDPVMGMKLYGYEKQLTWDLELGAKTSAYWYLTSTVLLLALAFGVDTLKAVGYSWIPFVFLLGDCLFISKAIEKLKVDPVVTYFWLVVALVVVGTLVF